MSTRDEGTAERRFFADPLLQSNNEEPSIKTEQQDLPSIASEDTLQATTLEPLPDKKELWCADHIYPWDTIHNKPFLWCHICNDECPSGQCPQCPGLAGYPSDTVRIQDIPEIIHRASERQSDRNTEPNQLCGHSATKTRIPIEIPPISTARPSAGYTKQLPTSLNSCKLNAHQKGIPPTSKKRKGEKCHFPKTSLDIVVPGTNNIQRRIQLRNSPDSDRDSTYGNKTANGKLDGSTLAGLSSRRKIDIREILTNAIKRQRFNSTKSNDDAGEESPISSTNNTTEKSSSKYKLKQTNGNTSSDSETQLSSRQDEVNSRGLEESEDDQMIEASEAEPLWTCVIRETSTPQTDQEGIKQATILEPPPAQQEPWCANHIYPWDTIHNKPLLWCHICNDEVPSGQCLQCPGLAGCPNDKMRLQYTHKSVHSAGDRQPDRNTECKQQHIYGNKTTEGKPDGSTLVGLSSGQEIDIQEILTHAIKRQRFNYTRSNDDAGDGSPICSTSNTTGKLFKI